MGKNNFPALSVIVSKTVGDTNTKLRLHFQLTPRSMTLDDLELL